MLYKSDEVRNEFLNDELCDYRVHAFLTELDRAFYKQFKRYITVTHICRTPEQQAIFYPNNPTKPSGHLERPARCADIRTRDLTADQIQFIMTWGKKYFPCVTLLLNDRGSNNPHIHIQFEGFNG